MRLSQGGQFRTQAVFLVSDLAERMEANKTGSVDLGAYVVATSGTPVAASTACQIAVCGAAALATFDLAQWQNVVAASLPQSTWTVARTVVGNPSTYTITVEAPNFKKGVNTEIKLDVGQRRTVDIELADAESALY